MPSSEVDELMLKVEHWSQRAQDYLDDGRTEDYLTAIDQMQLHQQHMALLTTQQASETMKLLDGWNRSSAASTAGKGNDRWLTHRQFVSAEDMEDVRGKPERNQPVAFMWKLKKEYDRRGIPEKDRLGEQQIKRRFREEK